jgi:hypothetical protein
MHFVTSLIILFEIYRNVVVSKCIVLLSLFCGRAAKMWFYAAAKICFHAAKSHVQKLLRHSRNKRMYTRTHFDTSLIHISGLCFIHTLTGAQ